MIKGISWPGKNPTQASVIHALRNLKSYNGNGLLPETINYSTDFGHDLPKSCGWYMIAEKNGFVARVEHRPTAARTSRARPRSSPERF